MVPFCNFYSVLYRYACTCFVMLKNITKPPLENKPQIVLTLQCSLIFRVYFCSSCVGL